MRHAIRKLTEREQAYATVENECLAAVCVCGGGGGGGEGVQVPQVPVWEGICCENRPSAFVVPAECTGEEQPGVEVGDVATALPLQTSRGETTSG